MKKISSIKCLRNELSQRIFTYSILPVSDYESDEPFSSGTRRVLLPFSIMALTN